MATQKCPKCKSSRVRIGYRPTPTLLKWLFRYNLLCDECNWEFTGFAIPGTVPRKSKKKRNTNETNSSRIQPIEVLSSEEVIEDSDKKDEVLKSATLAMIEESKGADSKPIKNKVRRKVRVKLH